MIQPRPKSKEAVWQPNGLWKVRGSRTAIAILAAPAISTSFQPKITAKAMVGMRINKGKFGGIDLSGLHWAGVVRWPGAMHEGNGELQPIVDVKASEDQRAAIFEALSGNHGDLLMEIIAAVCPKVHPPIFAPFEFAFDLEARKGLLKAGTALITEVKTLMTMGDLKNCHASMTHVKRGSHVGAKPVG